MALKPRAPRVSAALPPYQYKTTPFIHQNHTFEISRDLEAFGFIWDPGTGKSKTAIDTAADLFQRGKIDTVLVIAPNRVHRQWVRDEFPDHCPIPFRGAVYQSGRKNVEVDEVLRYPGLKVIAVNTELLSHTAGHDLLAKVTAGRRVLCVVDESHKFKTPGSSRTKTLLRFRDRFAYRRILTGTEFTTGYEDFYAQFLFLDPNILGCRTFTQFKNTYCITRQMGEHAYPVIVGYRNLHELQQRIAPYVTFADISQCPDMPAIAGDHVHTVEMTKAQTDAYTQMATEFLLEVEHGKLSHVDAPLMISRIGKLAQIASGHIQLGNGEWLPIEATPRFDLLHTLLDGAKGKVIVWCEFQPDVKQIAAHLEQWGITYVTYYGANKSRDNDANLDQFREDPSIKVFVATTPSGGTGHTIRQATTAIFYNVGTSFVNYKQAIRRNYRAGQTKPCVIHTIVADQTVDVKRYKTVTTRDSMMTLFRDTSVFTAWIKSPGRYERPAPVQEMDFSDLVGLAVHDALGIFGASLGGRPRIN